MMLLRFIFCFVCTIKLGCFGLEESFCNYRRNKRKILFSNIILTLGIWEIEKMIKGI